MNTDLARDEMIAAASPRDFTADMRGPVCWNVCEKCIRPFIGRAIRTFCAVCAPKEPE